MSIILPSGGGGLRTYQIQLSAPTFGLPAAETYLMATYSGLGDGANLSDTQPYIVNFGTQILGYTFSANTTITAWPVGLVYDLKIYKNAVLAATIPITSGTQFSNVTPTIIVIQGDLISASTTRTDGTGNPDYGDTVWAELFLQGA